MSKVSVKSGFEKLCRIIFIRKKLGNKGPKINGLKIATVFLKELI